MVNHHLVERLVFTFHTLGFFGPTFSQWQAKTYDQPSDFKMGKLKIYGVKAKMEFSFSQVSD